MIEGELRDDHPRILLDGDSLVGTELLRDMHLHVELAEGGSVLIESL